MTEEMAVTGMAIFSLEKWSRLTFMDKKLSFLQEFVPTS